MYAYGYKNQTQAWHTIANVEISGRPYEKYEVCRISCTAGFDIKNKILDISRLKDVPPEFVIAQHVIKNLRTLLQKLLFIYI